MSRAISREACRGEIKPWVGNRSHCLAVQYGPPTVEVPGPFPTSAPRLRRVRRGGRLPHYWELHPTEMQAKADALSVEVADLLCRGCGVKLARLTEEGLWP